MMNKAHELKDKAQNVYGKSYVFAEDGLYEVRKSCLIVWNKNFLGQPGRARLQTRRNSRVLNYEEDVYPLSAHSRRRTVSGIAQGNDDKGLINFWD